jgi:hypothetical protein
LEFAKSFLFGVPKNPLPLPRMEGAAFFLDREGAACKIENIYS